MLITHCHAINGWDVDVLVPGHGPVGGNKSSPRCGRLRVLKVEARKRYDKRMPPGVAAAEISLGRFDNWIGPERLIMDTVRWYAEWDGTLTPDYNANAVRQATIVQRRQGEGEEGERDHPAPADGRPRRSGVAGSRRETPASGVYSASTS